MIFNTTIYKAGEGGGAGGTELVVPAIGSVQTAEVNSKVLLVYANEVGGTDIAVTGNGVTTTQTIREAYSSTFSKLCVPFAVYEGSAYSITLSETSPDSYAAVYSSLATRFTSQYSWDIDPDLTMENFYEFKWRNEHGFMGFGKGTSFSYILVGGVTRACYGAKGGITGYQNSYDDSENGGKSKLTRVYNKDTLSLTNVADSDGLTFINLGGSVIGLCPKEGLVRTYDVNTGMVLDERPLSGADQSIRTGALGHALVDSGEYFVTWLDSLDINLYKLSKGSPWSIQKITTLNMEGISGYVQLIRSKSSGKYLHIFVVPQYCDDTNNVKHFIIDKETDEVTQGPDLIDSTGYNVIGASAFNEDKSRASFVLVDSTGGRPSKTIVSGLDMILPYEYAAVPFSSANLTDSAVTGFIKSQDGTDELGNAIATVEACLDPNATPPSTARIFGMNVTVNEGDPL